MTQVLTSVPDQRVNLLRWFLRVARSLWNIRNFNGAFEIVYGVTSQQLARLRSLVDVRVRDMYQTTHPRHTFQSRHSYCAVLC